MSVIHLMIVRTIHPVHSLFFQSTLLFLNLPSFLLNRAFLSEFIIYHFISSSLTTCFSRFFLWFLMVQRSQNSLFRHEIETRSISTSYWCSLKASTFGSLWTLGTLLLDFLNISNSNIRLISPFLIQNSNMKLGFSASFGGTLIIIITSSLHLFFFKTFIGRSTHHLVTVIICLLITKF